MNIIYIHTHDTGRYISPYGYNVDTPNLLNFAKEGTLFRHAYCAGPTCSPSRAGLLTGMAPHTCGMFGLAHRGFKLNNYNEHLVNLLKDNGYETVLCGVQHEATSGEIIGYDKILTEPRPANSGKWDFNAYDRNNLKRAVDYIKSKPKGPFFLSFGMVNTHRVFPEIDEDIDANYVQPPFPIYDTKQNREDMAAFMSSVRVVDECVGNILNAIKETGIEDECLIIFTTDHGIAFPKMKCNLYDTGIGISFIMKYPGNPCRGEAVDSLVSQLDFFPTVCDMLDIEKPQWLQGNSLMPLLNKQTDKIREEIFSEVSYHASYEPMRCIRTERYKLIRFFDNHDNIVPSNIDDGLAKEFLFEHGYLKTKRKKDMLFDLYFDPVERVNLVDDKEYKKIYEELSIKLEDWMSCTNDPLIYGKVEMPEGAIVNKLSCLSAEIDDFE